MEITIEKYQNIVDMLRSTDEENKVVALTIIEQLDLKDNITKILLLLKHSGTAGNLWKEHAPGVHEFTKKLSDDGVIDTAKHLTYKNVLAAMIHSDVSAADFEFYMKDFCEVYLLKQVKDMGYNKIKSISVLIKYEEDEQSRELSES
jgi:hypothetical protein